MLAGTVPYTLRNMDMTFSLSLSLTWAAIIGAAVFAATFFATGGVLRLLKSRNILDHPNARSSHVSPTPKGGGIAVVAVVCATWLGAGWESSAAHTIGVVVGAGLGLAALSWWDDLRGLNPLIRLFGHALAVAGVLIYAPLGGPVFGGLLPAGLDTLAAGLLWLWFINLFNFMDGIDGIAGTETATIGGGVALIAVVSQMSPLITIFGLSLAAAALGFLRWNRHPAKIFLGDVGSVPLGFLLGWLLLLLARQGEWGAALILPLYYLADATITICRRALRGEKVWQAHREHFYQHAVQSGLSHKDVVRHVSFVNFLLVVLAVAASRGFIWASLIAALVCVSWLLFFLSGDHTKHQD